MKTGVNVERGVNVLSEKNALPRIIIKELWENLIKKVKG